MGERDIIYIDFSAVYHAALKSVPEDERRAFVDEFKKSEAAGADTAGSATAGAAFVGCILDAFFSALDPKATQGKKFIFICEPSASECVRTARRVVAWVERLAIACVLLWSCTDVWNMHGGLTLSVRRGTNILTHLYNNIFLFSYFSLEPAHRPSMQVHVEAWQPIVPSCADDDIR